MKVSKEHVKDFYCLGGLLAQTNKGIFAAWLIRHEKSGDLGDLGLRKILLIVENFDENEK